VATEAAGIPLGIVSAGANRHDSPLLETDLRRRPGTGGTDAATGHRALDAGYDSGVTRDLLAQLGFDGEISARACPHRSRSASAGSSSARIRG